MAQGIGHTCGRAHAPCGNPGGVDQAYPQYGNYPSGSIGEFGFDVATSTVYDPASSFDFMTYCLNNAWVSPYTYEGLMNCFPAFSVAGEMVPRRRELLYVPCTIFRDGTVKTRGAGFHLQGYLDSYARSTTPYFVELHDEVGPSSRRGGSSSTIRTAACTTPHWISWPRFPGTTTRAP